MLVPSPLDEKTAKERAKLCEIYDWWFGRDLEQQNQAPAVVGARLKLNVTPVSTRATQEPESA